MLQETALRIVDGLLALEPGVGAGDGSTAAATEGTLTTTSRDPLKHPSCDAVLKVARFALWDHPKLVDSAVDLLDSIRANETTIRCYVSVCGASVRRKCWRVPGSDKGTEYTCLLHYCPCPTYTDMAKHVSGGSSTAMCKHLVAIRIASALALVQVSVLGEEQFVAKMCEPPVVSTHAANRMLRW